MIRSTDFAYNAGAEEKPGEAVKVLRMDGRLWLAGVAMALGLILWPTAPAWADGEGLVTEPASGAIEYLCPPRLHLRHPRRCTPAGPGMALAAYARQGVFPSNPLPVVPLDPELSVLPYTYIRVGKGGAKLYPTKRAALRGEDAWGSIPPGYLFVSWTDRYEEEGKVVYRSTTGSYLRGDNVSRISTPTFHGLQFWRTPERPFGWIMHNGYASAGPGRDQPLTGRLLYRYEVVQIYATRKVGDFEWYMIGPGEWIEQRQIAKVDPDPRRPEGVQEDRWISINLYEQTLAVYEEGELVYATLVSSGLRGWWTRPGAFQIFAKLEKDTMRGAFEADRSDYYYLEDVPWVLYYDQARALHGAYWHNNFGYPQSHGCVNLAPTDAHWIFHWAQEGTWVYVWDPSGQTPTQEE